MGQRRHPKPPWLQKLHWSRIGTSSFKLDDRLTSVRSVRCSALGNLKKLEEVNHANGERFYPISVIHIFSQRINMAYSFRHDIHCLCVVSRKNLRRTRLLLQSTEPLTLTHRQEDDIVALMPPDKRCIRQVAQCPCSLRQQSLS